MSDPQSARPNAADRAALRRAAAKALMLTILALIAAALGQQLPDRVWAALFAVLTALLLAMLVGLLLAVAFIGSYREDRAALVSGIAGVTGYVRRAGAWGLAAGGVGALLASALPRRLAEAGADDPVALPTAGFVAILLGGAGVAYGLLEEWREQVERDDEAPPERPGADRPDARTPDDR